MVMEDVKNHKFRAMLDGIGFNPPLGLGGAYIEKARSFACFERSQCPKMCSSWSRCFALRERSYPTEIPHIERS